MSVLGNVWHSWLRRIVVVVAIASVGGSENELNDAVNGNMTMPASIVALVNVSALSGSGFFVGQFCTGVIIGARSVATASHCVAGRRVADIAVVSGVTNLCTPGQNYEVAFVDGISQLPDKDAWDQSVITLRSDVRPQYVADVRTRVDLEEQLTVYGWGRDKQGQPSCSLRIHQLFLVSSWACERAGLGPQNLVLCAVPITSSSNTCAGDSGAPAFDEAGRPVALVSFGTGCGMTDIGSYGLLNKQIP